MPECTSELDLYEATERRVLVTRRPGNIITPQWARPAAIAGVMWFISDRDWAITKRDTLETIEQGRETSMTAAQEACDRAYLRAIGATNNRDAA